MDNTSLLIIAAIGGIILGFFDSGNASKSKNSKKLNSIDQKAKSIIAEAKKEGESIKKDKILQAKEKFLELKAEHEKVITAKDKKIGEAEKRTRDKESQVGNELAKNKRLNKELETQIQDYDHKHDILRRKQQES